MPPRPVSPVALDVSYILACSDAVAWWLAYDLAARGRQATIDSAGTVTRGPHPWQPRTGPVPCWRYIVHVDDRRHVVDVPTVPVSAVRYTGAPDDDHDHSPRVSVDGANLLWVDAVTALLGWPVPDTRRLPPPVPGEPLDAAT